MLSANLFETLFPYISVALFGLILGSFSTALIHRIPANIRILSASARSKCPHCALPLNARDLIPVFSWLWQKGHCRYCKARISARYPFAEILTAALALGFYAAHPYPALDFIPMALAAPVLVALVFIDLEHKILPNALVLTLAILGAIRLAVLIFAGAGDIKLLLFEFTSGAVVFAAAGLIMMFGFKKFANKDALGMGDIKFFAAAGLWLGLMNIGLFFILAGVFGVILGGAWKIFKKETAFPFGPALIAAFFLILCLDGSLFLEKAVKYL